MKTNQENIAPSGMINWPVCLVHIDRAVFFLMQERDTRVRPESDLFTQYDECVNTLNEVRKYLEKCL